MRINNLEFIRNGGSARRPEIVCWEQHPDGTEFKYTIMWWLESKEGFDIAFLGNRPFTAPDEENVLWDLMYYGQRVLDAEFHLLEKNA